MVVIAGRQDHGNLGLIDRHISSVKGMAAKQQASGLGFKPAGQPYAQRALWCRLLMDKYNSQVLFKLPQGLGLITARGLQSGIYPPDVADHWEAP
eukprot:12729259-Alexandrium_andersonii.AAC.1